MVLLSPHFFCLHWFPAFSVFLIVVERERSPLVEDAKLVFKPNLMKYGIKNEPIEFTRMDALVSERLTAYPQRADIYSLWCIYFIRILGGRQFASVSFLGD